jgi:hypothetical protein
MSDYARNKPPQSDVPMSNRTIAAQATRCHQDAMNLSHRLHDLLERLRSPRPAELVKGSNIMDSGHVTLEGTLEETLTELTAASSVLNEIEQYV